MAKTKFYKVHGECTDTHGDKHTVMLVGRLEWVKETVEVNDSATQDLIVSRLFRYRKKVLTIGMAICHKWDTFDEAIGEKIAKKRIKRGDVLGSLETRNFSMLTDDSVNAELLVKLSHVMKNIDKYLPEYDSQDLVTRYSVGENKFNVADASESEMISLLNATDDEAEFIIGNDKVIKKQEFCSVMREVMEKLRQETAHEEPAEEAEAPAEAPASAETAE